MFSARLKLLIGGLVFAAYANCFPLPAQDESSSQEKAKPRASSAVVGARSNKTALQTAAIHWQQVPLRDALARLQALFDESIFVDRRVDPSMRVSLDIESGSAEEVVRAIAAGHDLGVARLGSLVYLGPRGAADQLRAISAARTQETARLPPDLRMSLAQKLSISWPRLGEPRGAIGAILEHRGWRLVNADAIPHDLWSAGELPKLTLAEQLTVLLIGFDLTYELRPNDRSIEIVPLKGTFKSAGAGTVSKRSATPPSHTGNKQGVRLVYTLNVQEQPVGAILQALAKKRNWAIQIDDESIRKAGLSLDKRVSFSVEGVDREHLLDAILSPAGLDYRLDGDQVRIIPRRYGDK